MWAVWYICRVRRVGYTDDHALGNDNALVSSGRGAGAVGVCGQAGGQGVARRDWAAGL